MAEPEEGYNSGVSRTTSTDQDSIEDGYESGITRVVYGQVDENGDYTES